MKNPNPSGINNEQARESNNHHRRHHHHHHLNLNITKTSPPPSFFHCPISLEVMRSPVSLCTGVTYDRSSIKRWLDSGNTTCPATMQPLPSTELIPNLTLRRLIHQWSSEQHPPSLPHLANILANPFIDIAYKSSLLSSAALRPSALTSLFLSRETLQLAVTLVSLLLSLDFFDEERKRELTAAILSDLDAATSGIAAVLKAHSSSKLAAARVLEMLITEARTAITEKPELMKEMLKLLEENDPDLVDAGLRCLMGVIKEGGRERVLIVRMGVVPAVTKLMERKGDGIPTTVVAKAMVVMELAARCVEGLAAI